MKLPTFTMRGFKVTVSRASGASADGKTVLALFGFEWIASGQGQEVARGWQPTPGKALVAAREWVLLATAEKPKPESKPSESRKGRRQ